MGNDSMKIGILTFHNAHNYGAVLQAYALKTTIKALGHEVKIINYKNKAILDHYPVMLNTKCDEIQRKWQTQYLKFENFINSILLEGDVCCISSDEVKLQDVDCYIVGSDQVWEKWLTGGFDPVYFLDFETKAKKISYAASKTNAYIEEKDLDYFQSKLREFNKISVREDNFADNLRNYGIKATTVVDPTLFLDSYQYDELLGNKNLLERYILVYYLTENDELCKCAEHIAQKTNLPIKEIHFYHKEGFIDAQMADCGPEDFLKLFKNAEYIVTNSFHGVVFSIIYRKVFFAVYENDSRKDSILNKLGLESRHITNQKQISLELIDYTMAECRLNEIRVESLNYIKDALK